MEEKLNKSYEVEEIVLTNKKNGLSVIIGYIIGLVLSAILVITKINQVLTVLGFVYIFTGWILLFGLKLLNPNEALVLTLFGKYIGTLKGAGLYFVNPFCQSINPVATTRLKQSEDVEDYKTTDSGDNVSQMPKAPSNKISLKVITLDNNIQKINDCLGNPVEIRIAVIWRVKDTAKAVFNVDNYKAFLSLQTDTALRSVVQQYPYDLNASVDIDTDGDGVPDDGSLRGSSHIVARRIKEEIQNKVEFAGLEIIEARITHLSYAPEIASAMLQRQQASALIDARSMIVDGAVGMVEMALDKLENNQVVDLDQERKAAMVSNLLVVLCSNSEVSPIVNSGSLY